MSAPQQHGFKEIYGPWIHCLCGWNHHSLFEFLNNRALERHVTAMSRASSPEKGY